MALKKILPHLQHQDTILLQRIETIAVIELSPNGTVSPVVAAFTKAAEYLDERLGRDGEPAAVQFDYLGVTFHASGEMSEPTPSRDQDDY